MDIFPASAVRPGTRMYRDGAPTLSVYAVARPTPASVTIAYTRADGALGSINIPRDAPVRLLAPFVSV